MENQNMKLHDLYKVETGNWAVVDNKYTISYIHWLEQNVNKSQNTSIFAKCELKKALTNLIAIQNRYKSEEMEKNMDKADRMLKDGIL